MASDSTPLTHPPPRKKLHGRAFYESLGSPKFILAPMVDQSEYAWRMLCRSFLPPAQQSSLLAYTPMLHARLFANTPHYRATCFEPLRSGLPTEAPEVLPEVMEDQWARDGNPRTDRPLFVQFCANKPEELLSAAKHVAPYCDAVDLNLGCPQGIAKKGHYGAFLQESPDTIVSMIETLHHQLAVPITAKMRILDTKAATLAYARKILAAGASILTVHGRRREQKGHVTGLADWDMIKFLRQELGEEMVLFANGNVLQHGDLEECLKATGADGVMSAEGCLYDPSIFGGAAPAREKGEVEREYWTGRDGEGGYRMDAVMRRYMDIMWRDVLGQSPPARKPLWVIGEAVPAFEETEDEEPPAKKQKKEGKRSQGPNLGAIQPHLFHMLRPLVSKRTEIRDKLAKTRAGDLDGYEKILDAVERATIDGLQEYESNPDMMKELASEAQGKTKVEEVEGSSLKTVERCRRPWFICQPWVRPLPKEAMEKGAIRMSKKDMKKLDKEPRARTEAGVAVHGKVEPEVEGSREDGAVPAEKETVDVPKEGLVCG